MIASILLNLLEANLAAAVAVLLVLAVRKPVRTRLGARAAYALWLAPVAAAVAVSLPHPSIITPISPMMTSAEAAMVEAFVAQAPAAGASGLGAGMPLFAVWLIGTLATGGLVLWRQRRFTASMGRLTPSSIPGVFRADSPNVGPAVVGAFRPRIVAPADFETRFEPQERDLILAHERAHLAGGDASINALACAAQCLCWFNPLAHLAVRVLRIDQELACDATVIGRFPQMRRAYAELLLKTQIIAQPLPLGCHWPPSADHPLKERIAMLKSPLPALSLRTTGLVLAGALSLGIGGLAWSAQPEAGARAPAVTKANPPAPTPEAALAKFLQSPNWSRRPTAEDLMATYPAKAVKANLEGDVVLHCHVAATGKLANCGVLKETPQGAGFGAAAMKLTQLFEAREQTPEGGPKRGSDIRIPIRFRLPSAPAHAGK